MGLNDRTLRLAAAESNPNKVPSVLQVAGLDRLIQVSACAVRLTVASHIAVLPDSLKAAAILSAHATAGTSAGAKAPVLGAPSAGQVAINALGNIVFNATDAVTAAEVIYIPAQEPVVEEVVTVTSNVGTPLSNRKAMILLEATALTGTSVGAKAVQLRAASPSAGQAALNNAGNVAFNGTDAVTSARIRYIPFPGDGSAYLSPASKLETTTGI